MRVIAGKAKGRRLIAPKGKTVRPTADRVKEALFSIIGERVEGAAVLDLFCGSGALGIEALSRNASHATFVDHSAAGIRLTQENLELTGLAADATTIRSGIATWLRPQPGPFDLVFLDPPYDLSAEKVAEILELLAPVAVTSDDALIVLERSSKSAAPEIPKLELTQDRRYGDTTLSFYDRRRP